MQGNCRNLLWWCLCRRPIVSIRSSEKIKRHSQYLAHQFLVYTVILIHFQELDRFRNYCIHISAKILPLDTLQNPITWHNDVIKIHLHPKVSPLEARFNTIPTVPGSKNGSRTRSSMHDHILVHHSTKSSGMMIGNRPDIEQRSHSSFCNSIANRQGILIRSLDLNPSGNFPWEPELSGQNLSYSVHRLSSLHCYPLLRGVRVFCHFFHLKSFLDLGDKMTSYPNL